MASSSIKIASSAHVALCTFLPPHTISTTTHIRNNRIAATKKEHLIHRDRFGGCGLRQFFEHLKGMNAKRDGGFECRRPLRCGGGH